MRTGDALEFDISLCTRDAETCPVVSKAFDVDGFYSALQDLDPQAPEIRQMLGTYVTACVRGYCPGKAPELLDLIAPRSDEPPTES